MTRLPPDRLGKSTPWGMADFHKEYAEGIDSYGTPGHGGFEVSPEAKYLFPPGLKEYKTFAGGNWYEEDEDYAVVVGARPELFDAEARFGAYGSLRHMAKKSAAIARFFESEAGKAFAKGVEAWLKEATAAGLHRIGGSSTAGEGWSTWWRPVGGGKALLLKSEKHPPYGFKTAVELAELGELTEKTGATA